MENRSTHVHHGHRGGAPWASPPGMERSLWIAIAAWALLAVVGLVVFWPGDSERSGYTDEPRVNAQVLAVAVQPCSGTSVEDLVE